MVLKTTAFCYSFAVLVFSFNFSFLFVESCQSQHCSATYYHHCIPDSNVSNVTGYRSCRFVINDNFVRIFFILISVAIFVINDFCNIFPYKLACILADNDFKSKRYTFTDFDFINLPRDCSVVFSSVLSD